MDKNLVQLSKTISHALRHAPWVYELELDEQGWVELNDLLEVLREHRSYWRNIGLPELEIILQESDKQRFEIKDGRIRALYGHSTPQKLTKEPAEPPATLYHGTQTRVTNLIRESGLKPMRRQYVHLSVDTETAREVGNRKGEKTIILRIDAQAAHAAGVKFYRGNEMVWLADEVPPQFIAGL